MAVGEAGVPLFHHKNECGFLLLPVRRCYSNCFHPIAIVVDPKLFFFKSGFGSYFDLNLCTDSDPDLDSELDLDSDLNPDPDCL